VRGEIKIFCDKHKLKQFMALKPTFEKLLKGIAHLKDEERYTQSQQLG
jgi:hypothetical protein